MVLFGVAVPGAQALAAEAPPPAPLVGASGIDAGVEPPQIATGMAEPAALSTGAAPALALLGGFFGWLGRRRVARRGAWCRSR